MMQDRCTGSADRASFDEREPRLTLVDLLWQQGRVERWIRFGRKSYEQHLDRESSVAGFLPDSIFAFVRWAAGDFGTIASSIDILRAVGAGESYQTVPFVRPGAEILLRQNGWPKVERVLRAIDGIEALKIDPVEVSPEHWRHIQNRLAASDPPGDYTRAQHLAWLKRRRLLQ